MKIRAWTALLLFLLPMRALATTTIFPAVVYPIPCNRGGTGLTTTTVGAIILGSTSCSYTSLPDVAANGDVLTSNGVGAAPTWNNAPALFGNFFQTGSVPSTALANTVLLQGAANDYATRHAMTAGSYTFTFPSAYASTPVCEATPEGTLSLGLIQVAPTTTACVVTSAVGTDTRTVDILVIGNPN
jgi:hypothetical protein